MAVTEKINPASEFLSEYRLKETDSELHTLYKNSVFATDKLLGNYKAVFPYFTNHTFEHSSQVINYCNLIAGSENINKLNGDEIYIMLMGAALHDVGMGVSVADYDELKYKINGVKEYEQTHLMSSMSDIVRNFHEEFGAQLVLKYKDLFEIPTDLHAQLICNIIRGHRRLDILDEKKFTPTVCLQNGNEVRILYLAALVRLADELDITRDRNLLFDYSVPNVMWSPKQTMCYKCHAAIKRLVVSENSIILQFSTDQTDVYEEILNLGKKANATYLMYKSATEKFPEFTLSKDLKFECIME